MIEKEHIKDVAPYRAYCKATKIYKDPSQLYLIHGAERSFVTPIYIHELAIFPSYLLNLYSEQAWYNMNDCSS